MNKYSEWLPRKAIDEERCKNLALKWNISPLIARILLARGIEEEKVGEFLFPSFENTPDPFLMRDMDKAVERILLSFSRKEKVLIFGDFDVDGITATSLFLRFFKDLKFPSFYYIPHRLNEGYSLNKEAIQKAYKKGIKLIITCDCGSSSLEEIKFAHSLGMEVIVTDHHEVEFS
ncbi:DHH family phosphoesterase, partial [Candidatus Aerophobetes bacterium]|nr:DHH family phosphoesterase [Candidatus Aerophobetes bacterium]